MPNKNHKSGFTLIELSIVLVIIGLIVGGVLVGQDLIEAAKIRSTVSQIEQYKSAVNAFKLKYNELPGDMSASNASSFGFATRAGTAGRGDGNGIIEGGASDYVASFNAGELSLFWNDLGASGLIEGTYKGIDCTVGVPSNCTASSASIPPSQILPPLKVGNNSYMVATTYNKVNSFAIVGNINVVDNTGVLGISNPPHVNGLTPTQAYNIDKKLDDGLPLSGKAIATVGGGGTLTSLPTLLVGTASAGYCGNSDTTPTSYNTSPTYGNTYLCVLILMMQ